MTRPNGRTAKAERRADDSRTGPTVTVPDAATPEEAAAITAAVHTHLAEEAAAEAREDGPNRTEPWVLANRLHRVGMEADALLMAGAADAWTARSRSARR